MQLQGEIEVLLEDQKGRIKARESQKNTITDAYLRYVFYSMMTGDVTEDPYYAPAGLAAVLRSSGYSSEYMPSANLISRVAPTEFGIYAMNKNIDIQPDTFVPPYVAGNHTALDPGVTFYNANGVNSEDSKIMLPSPSGCYYDNHTLTFQTEYVKNTGTGTVQSVCIGRNHNNRQHHFFLRMSDSQPVADWSSGGAEFMLEHGTDFTKVWKKNGSYIYRCDFKNRTVETLTGSTQLLSNLSSYPWLVVGNVIFRVTQQSASGNTKVIRLLYRNDFKNSTTEAYKDITFTKRTDATLRTDTYPVLVYNPSTNKLLIFVTMSIGNHADGGFGCNVWKATVDGLDNPGSMTNTLTDMGVIPYAVSTQSASYDYNQHFPGLDYDSKLWLPYTFYAANENIYSLYDSTHCPGVVMPHNLSTTYKLINYHNNQLYHAVPVITGNGVKQFQLSDAKMPQIYMSQIVSGTNLASPITKGENDVLKIRYKYKLQ